MDLRFQRKLAADKLQHLLRRQKDGEIHDAGLVVLHEGMHDVLRGAQPGDIAQTIRETVAPYAKRLMICSIPEVETRGKAMRARAMLLNTELGKLCRTLKATFVDLSGMLAGEGRLAQDGIHYLAATTHHVATQLSQATRPSLGLQEPQRIRGKPSHTPRRKTGPNVPLPALKQQSSPPDPPGTANGTHNVHPRETRSEVQAPLRRTLYERSQPAYMMNSPHLPTLSTPPCPPRASSVPMTWVPHQAPPILQ